MSPPITLLEQLLSKKKHVSNVSPLFVLLDLPEESEHEKKGQTRNKHNQELQLEKKGSIHVDQTGWETLPTGFALNRRDYILYT